MLDAAHQFDECQFSEEVVESISKWLLSHRMRVAGLCTYWHAPWEAREDGTERGLYEYSSIVPEHGRYRGDMLLCGFGRAAAERHPQLLHVYAEARWEPCRWISSPDPYYSDDD